MRWGLRFGVLGLVWALSCTASFKEPPELHDDRVPPARVFNLAVTETTDTSVVLAWTAPGDDGLSGTPAGIDLRYVASDVSSSLDAETFAEAAAVEPLPEPGPGETRQSLEVTGLAGDRSYCFALRAWDDAGNQAPLSNVACGATRDVTPPGAVVDLEVVPDPRGRRLALSWTLPADEDLAGTVVLRVEGEEPVPEPPDDRTPPNPPARST